MSLSKTLRRSLLLVASADGILISIYSVYSQSPLQVGFGVLTVN